MNLLAMLLVLAVLAAPVVVLLRRPGWPAVRESHPDAARLAHEAAVMAARESQS